jgi:hypothetical protein
MEGKARENPLKRIPGGAPSVRSACELSPGERVIPIPVRAEIAELAHCSAAVELALDS